MYTQPFWNTYLKCFTKKLVWNLRISKNLQNTKFLCNFWEQFWSHNFIFLHFPKLLVSYFSQLFCNLLDFYWEDTYVVKKLYRNTHIHVIKKNKYKIFWFSQTYWNYFQLWNLLDFCWKVSFNVKETILHFKGFEIDVKKSKL